MISVTDPYGRKAGFAILKQEKALVCTKYKVRQANFLF
jgi:hypothetical protein